MAQRSSLALCKLPPHPFFKDGYCLRKRASVAETPAPGYGPGKVFQSEYDVVREVSEKTTQRWGHKHTQPLKLFPSPNDKENPRWDLRVRLLGQDGQQKQVPYAWLVSCALLKAAQDTNGRSSQEHYVQPADWKHYQGDHWPIADQCDCRLLNLRPRVQERHQSEDRFGWQRTKVPNAQRGLKRPASVLRKLRSKAKAEAKAKAKGQAKRTRSWQ